MRPVWVFLIAAASYCAGALAQSNGAPVPAGYVSWQSVWIALITPIPPTLVALGALIVSWRSGAKADTATAAATGAQKQAVVAATAAEHTAVAADERLARLETVTHEVHSLVDGAMGEQLKLTARATRRLADLTQDPRDIEAAVNAEAALQEHMRRFNATGAPQHQPMPVSSKENK